MSHGVVNVNRIHQRAGTVRLSWTAAQTNVALVSASPGQKIVVKRVAFTSAAGNAAAVSFRLGFGTVTTPTAAGVISSHPGVAAGSGLIEVDPSGLGSGALDEDVRLTADAASVGAEIVISYWLEGA